MVPEFKDIERFLPVLGLDPSQVPTFTEYKIAYWSMKNLHPDKRTGAKNSTAEFQEITEAARHILLFLTNNKVHQKREDTKEDGALMMSSYEESNNLE